MPLDRKASRSKLLFVAFGTTIFGFGATALTGVSVRPVYSADSSDQLDTCAWERVDDTTANNAVASCPTGTRIFSGGCYNSNVASALLKQEPYEAGSYGNRPNNGDKWYATTHQTGYRCTWDTTSGTKSAFALCCGD